MAIFAGEDFELSTSNTSQVRLDSDAVKELLEELLLQGKITAGQKLACFKEIPMETIRTNRIDSSKKIKFVPPSLTQMTPAGCTDLLGSLRERMSNDKKEEGIYKDWLKAHFKGNPLPTDDDVAAKAAALDEDKPDWAQ